MSQKQKRKKCLIFSLIGIFLFSAGFLAAQENITVNPDIRYQTTEGWGTSLCWFGNVIGQWSDSNRNAVADLLFSHSNGLGLNLIRYNIGGGDNPSHNHMGYGKEMPGFKPSANGPYDWNADPGQRWMLQAAKSRIASDEFIAEAFSNSPPYWMTNSGCASGANGGGNNLRSSYYDDFADYLTEVLIHFQDSWGVSFRTIEPMNEPNGSWWNANGGQEGCHFDRSVQDDIIRELRTKLDAKGLNTEIAAMDESGIDDTLYSYNTYDGTTRRYISQINTHVYSGQNRSGLKALAANEGKRLWQSECDGSGAPAPFDVFPHNHNNIEVGLDISMRIIRDLRDMQPDGWIFWQAVESEQTQTSLNKNWGLLHADFQNGSQAYYLTKKYYTMAQYSKHIRPGDTMIDINNSDAVAFINSEENAIVIVQRNASSSDRAYSYNLNQFSPDSNAMVYRTSSNENYQRLSNISLSGSLLNATARAKSITTYIISGNYTGNNSGESVMINDNTIGTGLNQFEYVGSWNSGSQSGAYQSDNHWNSDANEYYQVRFQGTQFEIYSARASNHGIFAVSVDGGNETLVDLYSSTRTDQSLVYTSPVLADGNHTLRVRVTGSQNSNASGATVVADLVKVLVSSPPDGNPGDVNSDGQTDIVDALLITQFYVGLNPQNFNQANGDVNNDDQITIDDALLVAQYDVGLVPEL